MHHPYKEKRFHEKLREINFITKLLYTVTCFHDFISSENRTSAVVRFSFLLRKELRITENLGNGNGIINFEEHRVFTIILGG